VRIILGLVVILLVGCKDKPKTDPVSPSDPGSAGSATVGSGWTPKVPKKPELVLPPLSGKAAAKTKAKHTKEQLEALSKLEYKGFARDLRKLDTSFLNVKQRTESRPKLGVTITIMPCMKCLPLQADKWRAEKDALKVTLAPELHDRPDTIFEVGESTLGGEKVIYTYQLGQYFGKDENGNPQGAYSNAYILYHNDGVNQIRVIAEYIDDALATKEDLARAVPREHLEKVATAFLDSYTQAWAN